MWLAHGDVTVDECVGAARVPIVPTEVKLRSAKHPLPRLSLGNMKHLPSLVVCLR